MVCSLRSGDCNGPDPGRPAACGRARGRRLPGQSREALPVRAPVPRRRWRSGPPPTRRPPGSGPQHRSAFPASLRRHEPPVLPATGRHGPSPCRPQSTSIRTPGRPSGVPRKHPPGRLRTLPVRAARSAAEDCGVGRLGSPVPGAGARRRGRVGKMVESTLSRQRGESARMAAPLPVETADDRRPGSRRRGCHERPCPRPSTDSARSTPRTRERGQAGRDRARVPAQSPGAATAPRTGEGDRARVLDAVRRGGRTVPARVLRGGCGAARECPVARLRPRARSARAIGLALYPLDIDGAIASNRTRRTRRRRSQRARPAVRGVLGSRCRPTRTSRTWTCAAGGWRSCCCGTCTSRARLDRR